MLVAEKEKIDHMIQQCRKLGLRRTKALEEVLRELVSRDCPVTLADLTDSERISNQCDKATVYRLLIRLQEKGVVRRLGFHERAARYIIKYPGEHYDFLICTECGSIDKLNISCPVERLEKEIASKSGFREVYHELEFFGVCPSCT